MVAPPTASLQVKGTGQCLTVLGGNVEGCDNVWGRVLDDGSVGLTMLNNGDSSGTVTCDADCFQQLDLPGRNYTVRDLWLQQDVQVLTPISMALSATVAAQGGARLFRLTPQ